MAEKSAIQWTDHTFNPWSGCTKVAEGCKFCYAEVNYSVKMRGVKWGPNGNRVLASDAMWREPLKWNRQAEKAGVRKRVFCASLADVFEDWTGEIRDSHNAVLHRCHNGHLVPCQSVHANGTECDGGCSSTAMPLALEDVRRRLFALIDATPHLDWQLLTKRPENIRRMWPVVGYVHTDEEWAEVEAKLISVSPPKDGMHYCRPSVFKRDNVWLGCSFSTQADADKNLPELLKCRDLAPVLFVSAEPLIEAVDLGLCEIANTAATIEDDPRYGIYPDGSTNHSPPGMWLCSAKKHWRWMDFRRHYCGVDWVIAGGESGSHARPCDVAWIRSLKDQCAAADVACFVKQLGANIIDHESTAAYTCHKAQCWPEGFKQDGHRIILTDKKGGEQIEWPEDLRVCQFPKATVPNA